MTAADSDDDKAMFIASPREISSSETQWPIDSMFQVSEHFARTFATTGEFVEKSPPSGEAPVPNEFGVGSLGFSLTLKPGQTKTVPLVIGWYFPVFAPADPADLNQGLGGPKSWRNYYAVQFKSGLDVARYVVKNLKRLEADTRLFQQTFFSSTMPGTLLEAVSSNLSVLRSPTIIRYPDGTLYGWEGCEFNRRLGLGTCNHVWNYHHSIPYLFPKLQRSILENFYFNALRESDGCVEHRVPLGPGNKANHFYAAADGQLGMVSQVYRDWQICGDDAWLKKVWPKVKKSLEYAWVDWDKDRDGLMEGMCGNTLDLKFSTPETMTGSHYQAALLAAEKISLYLGDKESAGQYRKVFESGKKLSDEKLFNGEYYWQMQPAVGKLQLETGSLSEQLHGQLYARLNGLEDIYDKQNMHTALGSLFKNHYRSDFYDFINCGRVYSHGDDRGLLVATWPRGGRPETPLLYCDETWTGFEYQVASNLLYDGYILEGLTVIKSARGRYNGKKRNPFSEFEWGNHYARSMSSYSVLPAMSRWRYSGVEKMMTWDPSLNSNDFRCFFAVDSGWGIVGQKKKRRMLTALVEVAKGKVTLQKIVVRPDRKVKIAKATIGEAAVGAAIKPYGNGMIEVSLSKPVDIVSGIPLTIELR